MCWPRGHSQKEPSKVDFGVRQTWIQIPALLPLSCGILGKALCSFEPQLLKLWNESNSITHVTGLLLWGSNGVMSGQDQVLHPACGEEHLELRCDQHLLLLNLGSESILGLLPPNCPYHPHSACCPKHGCLPLELCGGGEVYRQKVQPEWSRPQLWCWSLGFDLIHFSRLQGKHLWPNPPWRS